jgi:hypothetical protein
MEEIAPAMRHKCILLLLSGFMVVSMMGCGPALSSPSPGGNGGTPLPDTPTGKPTAISPTVTGAVEPQPSAPISIPLESALQQVVTQARKDLAQRLGVPADSVTVDAVIGQEFSTDAFYCRTSKDRISKDESPQVVSGQSILLSASARRYEYHASGQTVIFCRPLP